MNAMYAVSEASLLNSTMTFQGKVYHLDKGSKSFKYFAPSAFFTHGTLFVNV